MADLRDQVMPMPFDYSQVEERIRPHVRRLHDNGFRTTASCGHEMWVVVDCQLHEISKLHDYLRAEYEAAFEIVVDPQQHWPSKPWIRVKLTGDLAGDGKPEDFVLLKVDPASHPLYFVIRQRHYEWTDNSNEDGKESYFYEEHTCPTNWTGDIEAVIARGNPDPHGFATFVRRLSVADDTPTDGNGEPDWQEFFPEAFTDG